MISQLVAIFLVFLVTYLIGRYLKDGENHFRVIPHDGKATSTKAVDIGLWGTIQIAWKFRATLWDFIPPYQRGMEILDEYSTGMARVFYPTNWKSAHRLVLCSDLKTMKEAFSSDQWLQRAPDDHYIYATSFGKPLGILGGNGPYWSTARKIVMAAFRKHGIQDAAHLEQVLSEEIHLVVNGIRDRFGEDKTKDFAVFSPNHIFHEAALNVMFKILFSRKLSKTDPLEKDLVEWMNYQNDMFRAGLCAADFLPFLSYFPSLVPSLRENLKFSRAVYDIVDKEGKARRRTGSNFSDLMDSFLKKVDEHQGTHPNYFTFENLQSTIRDLLMAGSDTTHVTLQHLMLFMAKNKKDQKMVQDEIDRVVGPDRFPTYNDRTRMIYTQAVIQETLRLGSTTPVSARVNKEDCQLGGMNLKKGTFLIPLYIGVNHSKEIWEDPMVFRPSRFICETTGQITNRDKTVTFAYGPRACPGELLARVALFMFTVALLREFEWELSDMHPPPSTQCHGGLTRVPAQYYVKIRRRFQ